MTGAADREPVLQQLRGRSRRYLRADQGRVVPSVTTVISLTPKPYLMNWVVKLAADWAASHVHDLAAMDYDERLALIKAETTLLREEGARKGTAVHEYAEQYVWMGCVDPPRNTAEQSVVDLVDALKPRVLYAEAMVWNGEHGYAGTVDGIWEVIYDGHVQTWLVDWKTSKSRTAEWALQLQAYARAETVVDGRGNEYPMPHIDRMVALWVPFDGPWQVLPVEHSDADWQTFLACLTVLRWHDATGVGDVLGSPLYDGLTTAPTTNGSETTA